MTESKTSINKLTPPPETVTTKDGLKIETTGDRWQLSQVGLTYTLDFTRFKNICTPAFVNGLKWACYKRLSKVKASKAYNDLSKLINYLESFFEHKGTQIDLYSESDLLNLKGENVQLFQVLRGLFRTWVENGYYGLAPEILVVLNHTTRLKRNSCRIKVVDTLCPERGPLLELEENLYNQALKDLYAKNEISHEDYLKCKLTLVFGARPVQWEKLKIRNLVVEQLIGGRSYSLLIPWAKQKKNKPPRSFPLTRHLGEMLFGQAERVKMRFPMESLSEGMTWDQLPLFPQAEKAYPTPSSANVIALQITRVGKKANILNQREGRDEEPIMIGAMRLRHTVGTRLATRGQYGARDIANYLLHSDINSPRSYVELKEYLLENFNAYWNVRLEANAKVALGIIDAEEAKRMNAPHITFSEDGTRRSKVGKCGKTGCDARAPLACYPCSKFRPLLDAPHNVYLNVLLIERDRQLELAPKHIGVYDNTIWYVRRVIEACEQIRSGGE